MTLTNQPVGDCRICGSRNQLLLYSGLLLKCMVCGYTAARVDISIPEINSIYGEKYFIKGAYDNYPRDRKEFQKNFTNRMIEIEKVIPPKWLRRILEIGCAYGFFGDLVIKRWNAGYMGIEIATEAADFARSELNLKVLNDDYLNLQFGDEAFDSLFLWDVIEHLPDPFKIIQKAAGEISKRGFLVLSTGDIGSRLARIQGKHWRLIHPPTHLHYFTKEAISRLLNQHGFEVVSITYPSIARSLKQVIYALFLSKSVKNLKLMNALYNLIPETMYLKVNTFDIMLVIARKT